MGALCNTDSRERDQQEEQKDIFVSPKGIIICSPLKQLLQAIEGDKRHPIYTLDSSKDQDEDYREGLLCQLNIKFYTSYWDTLKKNQPKFYKMEKQAALQNLFNLLIDRYRTEKESLLGLKSELMEANDSDIPSILLNSVTKYPYVLNFINTVMRLAKNPLHLAHIRYPLYFLFHTLNNQPVTKSAFVCYAVFHFTDQQLGKIKSIFKQKEVFSFSGFVMAFSDQSEAKSFISRQNKNSQLKPVKFQLQISGKYQQTGFYTLHEVIEENVLGAGEQVETGINSRILKSNKSSFKLLNVLNTFKLKKSQIQNVFIATQGEQKIIESKRSRFESQFSSVQQRLYLRSQMCKVLLRHYIFNQADLLSLVKKNKQATKLLSQLPQQIPKQMKIYFDLSSIQSIEVHQTQNIFQTHNKLINEIKKSEIPEVKANLLRILSKFEKPKNKMDFEKLLQEFKFKAESGYCYLIKTMIRLMHTLKEDNVNAKEEVEKWKKRTEDNNCSSSLTRLITNQINREIDDYKGNLSETLNKTVSNIEKVFLNFTIT